MHLLDFFDKFSLRPENAEELKGLILDLAIRGQLTEEWRKEHPINLSPAGGGAGGGTTAGIEPASVLLQRIQAEKARLVKEKKIKKEKPLPEITEEEIPFELPDGWEWCRLGEISINRDGERKPITKADRQHGKYDYYGASGIIDKVDDFIFSKDLLLIGEDGANLVNRSTPIAFFARGKYWVNNHAHVLDSVNFETLEYLEIYINSIDLKPFLTGMAQPKLPQKRMNPILIPLPPLPEQQAIVAIVNQLMAEVDELQAQTTERAQLRQNYVQSALRRLTTEDSEAAWQRLQPHVPDFFDTVESIDKLKEAILQLAVQGKLTKQWRLDHPDVEPASVLLEKIKEEKARLIKEKKIKKEKALPEITEEEIPFELPEGWEWSDLQTLCERVTDGFHHTPKKLNIGYKYISATHIKEDGIKWNDSLHIGEKDHKNLYKKAQPRRGDILIVNRGAGCGTTAIVDMDEEFSFQNAALIGFNLKSIDANYMNIILRNKKNEMFNDFAQGGAQPMISNKKLKTLTIPLAPGEEQKAIVQIVNQLMDYCDQMKSEIENRNTLSTDFLRSSIREVMEKTQSLA